MKWIAGIILGWLLLLAGAALYFGMGSFNIAASDPPGRFEEALARLALNRSIARRAPLARNPVEPTVEVLGAGLSHYRENCLGCHGAPGVDAAEYGQGLNPAAPDLTLVRVQKRSDGQLYWIVANGLRMTGMPAFSPTHKPEEIWKIVAFLRHLPELTPAEEQELKDVMERAARHHAEEARPK